MFEIAAYSRHLALSCALALLGGCAHHATIEARMPNPGEAPHGISVSGQGDAKAAPDIARANLGVDVRGASVEQATNEANTRMAAITAALKQSGIADKDMRTHGFSIYFEQEPVPPIPMPVPPQAPTTRGGKAGAESAPSVTTAAPEQAGARGHYRVSNMLEITVRDMKSIGRVLNAATAAGANNVWGIQFDIEDQQALIARARAQAIERAKQNAADLARLTGVKLGKVVSVSESGGGYPQPMMSKAMRQEAAQDVPVETGEITVSHSVQLVYSVEE